MELTPRGNVMLWIRIVGFLGPFDGVPHSFHDSYNLQGLDVEVVLWDTSAVNLSYRVITRLGGRSVKWAIFVACWSFLQSHRVGLR